MKRYLSLMLALLMALTLAACGTAKEPAAQPDDGGTQTETPAAPAVKELTWARAYESTSLDPAESADDESNNIVSYTTEGLVRVMNSEIVPGIAESWDISDDGLTYTFHLRQSTWSDGTPLTAQDFVYSFFRLIDPNAGHSQASSGYCVAKAQAYAEGGAAKEEVGFAAPDDQTVVITFAHTGLENLYLAAGNAFHPVQQAAAEAAAEAYGSDLQYVLGNGPMVITEWSHENRIVLEKNANYWNADSIRITKLTGLCNVSNDTAAEMMQTGDVDVATFADPTYYQPLLDAGFGQQTYCNTDQFIHINMNGKSTDSGRFLANADFRRALSYAIDRTAICSTVMLGQTPASRFIDPNAAGVSGKFTDEYPVTEQINVTADAAKAQEYLQKALTELNADIGDVPEFSMLCYDTQGNLTKLQAVQDMFLNVLGIKCVIDPQPIQQMIAKVYAGDFDFWTGGVSIGVMDAASSGGAFSYWDCDDPDAHFGYANKDYAALLDTAQYATDRKTRCDAIAGMEKIFIDEVPSLLITWQTQNIMYRSGVVITNVDSSYGADLAFADIQD